MRKFIGISLAFLFLLNFQIPVLGYHSFDKVCSCDDKELLRIDSVVSDIQSTVHSIKPLVTVIDSITVLNAYYREGYILEVEIVTNTPVLKRRCIYYIENGFLIKVLEKNYDLRDNEMKEPVETTHYYFKDDKMICWLTNELESVPRNKVYETTERTLLNNIDKYFLMIQ